MLGPSLTVLHLAIATVCTALMIGLGFLARPQRSTVLWSTMFVVAMAGSFGALTSAALESRAFWLISMSLVLTVPFLLWSGLRAHRGARYSYAWVAAVVGVVLIVIFVIGAGRPGFPIIGRVSMLLAATVNIVVLGELLRRPERGRGAAVPLLLATALWMLLSVVGVIAAILNLTENYELLTQTNSVGLSIYMICALVSLLFFIRGDGTGAVVGDGAAFRVVAADRLARARAAEENTWTLLDIRLDDPVDLRGASGDGAFAGLSARFHELVRAAFPAEADVAAFSETRAVVLLARTETVVRSHVRRLMESLAVADTEAPVMLQLSVSVGWADATRCAFDVDALLATAAAQADGAVAAGGDRWQRA
ncbi:hypothetical protein [Microbacterium lacus]|uniref:GGDEF domain-containing protein n=1 Tax=Microbacterium lacus TaxID=415217 RepID=A0ABN2G6T4_9MICO